MALNLRFVFKRIGRKSMSSQLLILDVTPCKLVNNIIRIEQFVFKLISIGKFSTWSAVIASCTASISS